MFPLYNIYKHGNRYSHLSDNKLINNTKLNKIVCQLSLGIIGQDIISLVLFFDLFTFRYVEISHSLMIFLFLVSHLQYNKNTEGG